MRLAYFYDDRLAQASYLVGCAATGEALVIDPARDITPYLALADQEGLRITHVTETHIHADFVSGVRELAAITGATLYLSDMGDADWKYADAHAPNVRLLYDGDTFMVGNVRIEVLHTPGHTPEHLSFQFTDTAAADKPMGIFTGDFLFVGDVGRPDLLEVAAGISGTKDPGARQQFHTVQRFKSLPDYLQILPGHGAGSACGKALGAIPSTTLGYEKLFNPAFQFTDEDAFVRWLLDGQPEAPRYFAQMKSVNKAGAALLRTLPHPAPMDKTALRAAIQNGDLVIDLRARNDFAEAHLPGTISIPAASRNFTTYVGWFVDYTRPTYLILDRGAVLPDMLTALRGIGVDQVSGYALADRILDEGETLPTITVPELAARLPSEVITILDVRGQSEFCEGHIAGAQHLPLGDLPLRLDALPKDHLIVAQCSSGYRSQIAASWLRAKGFTNVVTLGEGKRVWEHAFRTAVCPA
ncbi:MAG TPA: MBL fold metallo-hydrolase [Aggregatilineales bacterium]|nr:MBL fold metallo-hydrolase [Anaerolineales bacterium]HRE47237.1 MBL fold metallo-hydrolase [Aggregatilineales bacterium]